MTYWSYACQIVVYLQNKLPPKILDVVSPCEVMYSNSLDYNSLISFGCVVFLYLRAYVKHKLEPRFSTCVFLDTCAWITLMERFLQVGLFSFMKEHSSFSKITHLLKLVIIDNISLIVHLLPPSNSSFKLREQ